MAANPVVYSLFFSHYLASWDGDLFDIDAARNIVDLQGSPDNKYCVLYQKSTVVTIAAAAGTASIAIPGLATTDNVIILGNIVGDGSVRVVGQEWATTTPITADLRGVGVEKFPAKVLYSGSKVTGVTLVANTAGTQFHVKVLIACAATDPRYEL